MLRLLFKDVLNVCKSPCCLSLLRTSEERLVTTFSHPQTIQLSFAFSFDCKLAQMTWNKKLG